MVLPKIGDNRALLTAIVASAIPLAVAAWVISNIFGDAIDAKDVAVVIVAISGPLGFLVGRKDREE